MKGIYAAIWVPPIPRMTTAPWRFRWGPSDGAPPDREAPEPFCWGHRDSPSLRRSCSPPGAPK
jgi:hypothetical protein